MAKRIRVIQYGLGAMGSVMAKTILEKRDLQLVGVICHRPEDAGKDLAYWIGAKKPTGIKASNDPEKIFKTVKADVVLQATVSYVPNVWEQIRPAVQAGMNVITIAEEMGYPFLKYPNLCKQMDREAKKHGVSILGTGINPGFAMDLMPLMLSGICQEVRRVQVTRLINFAPFGPAIQKNIGIGLSPHEFKKGVKSGALPLHIGLPESLAMLAQGLGWSIDEVKETRTPVLAQKSLPIPGYKTIEKGKVIGFNHRCYGFHKGKWKILLEELGNVDPKLDYKNSILIEGIPSLTEIINVPMGHLTTTSHAVNVIPKVLQASPGLLSMKDLLPAPCLPPL